MKKKTLVKTSSNLNQKRERSDSGSSIESDEYVVEYLYGKKLDEKYRDVKYLVKWKGYPFEESTWEPPKHLENVKNLIKKFEKFTSRNIFDTILKSKEEVHNNIESELEEDDEEDIFERKTIKTKNPEQSTSFDNYMKETPSQQLKSGLKSKDYDERNFELTSNENYDSKKTETTSSALSKDFEKNKNNKKKERKEEKKHSSIYPEGEKNSSSSENSFKLKKKIAKNLENKKDHTTKTIRIDMSFRDSVSKKPATRDPKVIEDRINDKKTENIPLATKESTSLSKSKENSKQRNEFVMGLMREKTNSVETRTYEGLALLQGFNMNSFDPIKHSSYLGIQSSAGFPDPEHKSFTDYGEAIKKKPKLESNFGNGNSPEAQAIFNRGSGTERSLVKPWSSTVNGMGESKLSRKEISEDREEKKAPWNTKPVVPLQDEYSLYSQEKKNTQTDWDNECWSEEVIKENERELKKLNSQNDVRNNGYNRQSEKAFTNSKSGAEPSSTTYIPPRSEKNVPNANNYFIQKDLGNKRSPQSESRWAANEVFLHHKKSMDKSKEEWSGLNWICNNRNTTDWINDPEKNNSEKSNKFEKYANSSKDEVMQKGKTDREAPILNEKILPKFNEHPGRREIAQQKQFFNETKALEMPRKENDIDHEKLAADKHHLEYNRYVSEIKKPDVAQTNLDNFENDGWSDDVCQQTALEISLRKPIENYNQISKISNPSNRVGNTTAPVENIKQAVSQDSFPVLPPRLDQSGIDYKLSISPKVFPPKILVETNNNYDSYLKGINPGLPPKEIVNLSGNINLNGSAFSYINPSRSAFSEFNKADHRQVSPQENKTSNLSLFEASQADQRKSPIKKREKKPTRSRDRKSKSKRKIKERKKSTSNSPKSLLVEKAKRFNVITLESAYQERYGNPKTDSVDQLLGHYCPFKEKDKSDSKEKIHSLDNVIFKVEWATRTDGFKPLNSYYTYNDLKFNHPRKLLEYLERRARVSFIKTFRNSDK